MQKLHRLVYSALPNDDEILEVSCRLTAENTANGVRTLTHAMTASRTWTQVAR